ncbi:DUF262 domain-containing protein [Alloscardovia venturai]|uniref:DUF262 domain-containing protein n=1 Tax=Alloscardovia venturai TaxID=1769421 RepID=A0ABW2Y8Q9_9BIFI
MAYSPREISIEDIFSGNKRYKIPNFQRDFSWEDSNFDDFLDDLFSSSGINCKVQDFDHDNRYFFGMILVLGDKISSDIDKPYQVIDGQQRLTTMTLFFAAITEIIHTLNDDYRVEFGDRLYATRNKQGKSEQVHRLVNDALNPLLPEKILNLNGAGDLSAKVDIQSDEQKHLLDAYEYIKNILSKKEISMRMHVDIEDLNDALYISILEALGDYLSNSTLICIYNDSLEEANKLFRNLNSRGKKLDPPDLIKNEIFSILEDESQSASTRWMQIEKNIYESEENLQTFIFHFMRGRYKSITKNNLYERFMSRVEPSAESYMEFLESLVQASQYYKIMLNPTDKTEIFGQKKYFSQKDHWQIKSDLEFFNGIDVSQLRILLITLFEVFDKKKMSSAQFRKFIRITALHQCMHVLVHSSANKLTTIYANTSQELLKYRNKENWSTNDVDNAYKEYEAALVGKLPSENFVESVNLTYDAKKLDNSKKGKEYALIKFVLETLAVNRQEQTIKSNKGLKFIYDATIEHIIDRENIKDNASEGWINSLGNLLLLEQGKHYSNVKSEEEKRNMYSKSDITMTNQFFTDFPNFYSDTPNQSGIKESIESRNKSLLKQFDNIVRPPKSE